ncbi:MAG TPA: molybdopterin cofactor-binding domain-containing protein [Gaiellaceae bacterium]|nr:molybdopterin cofactor-binding domain-containing protein [Gaiellaceae bacterium]
MTQITERTLSRRDFLKEGGALVVAFSVPLSLGGVARASSTRAQQIGPASIDPSLIDSWIAVKENGRVTIKVGKVELGTALRTAQMQIAADELDVSLDKIDYIQGDTWVTPDQGTTAGSQSLKTQWANGLRHAAAEARAVLLSLASQRLGAPVSELVVTDGVVSVKSDPAKKVSYGELVGGRRFDVKITGKVEPKKPSELKVVGRPVKAVDLEAKVRSRHQYIHNLTVPGMLHGRVVRPPGINATLVSVDGFPKRIEGLVKVVVEKDFVGVVCEREEQAIKAAQTLKVTWKDPGGVPTHDELFASMVKQVGTARLLAADGDVDKAMAGAAKVLEAVYYYPYQLHGSMGPSCAIADVRGEEVTVWSSTQGVYPLRQAIARMLGLPARNVHVIYVEGSGCYGLNGADTVSLDAVVMSKHVGRPVRVQWMRPDEHVWEHYGTPMVMRLRGGLDAEGNLVAWDYEGWQASRGGRPGNVGAANLPTGYLIGLRLPPRNVQAPRFPPLGADSSNTQAGYLPDEDGLVANTRVIAHTVDSPFFTGPLRSPARIQNTFANESFIDELAAAAKVDPVEFRLRYIGDPRLAHVLRVAAKAAGWEARPSPKRSTGGRIATGRGIAAMQYEGSDGYAGTVAEVEVDRRTGKVRVTRVVVSHDVGIIINPNGLKAQIEGNVVHGVSRALKEEVQLNRRTSASRDWESYQVLRFTELPEIKIALINRVNEPAMGSGENAMTAIPAAIGNAIFDATGARLRRVPFTPARVRAALR